MEWIKAEDRLPERDTDVLAFQKRHANGFYDMFVMYVCDETGLWKYSIDDSKFYSGPENYVLTHWAELPEPPQDQ